MTSNEVERVRERYGRRDTAANAARYDPLAPDVLRSEQARDRALVRLIRTVGLAPLLDKTLLEVGCGNGMNLLRLLRLGFSPAKLIGNELLPERFAAARCLLPEGVRLYPGDAAQLPIERGSIDIVHQATVFSSLLDTAYQQLLATQMWAWVRPGGGILWYDFVYDNPSNPDVRGVPLRRVRELFPDGPITSWRVTLAPPIARAVARSFPALYSILESLPILRSHVLCWIAKPM